MNLTLNTRTRYQRFLFDLLTRPVIGWSHDIERVENSRLCWAPTGDGKTWLLRPIGALHGLTGLAVREKTHPPASQAVTTPPRVAPKVLVVARSRWDYHQACEKEGVDPFRGAVHVISEHQARGRNVEKVIVHSFPPKMAQSDRTRLLRSLAICLRVGDNPQMVDGDGQSIIYSWDAPDFSV